MASRTSFGVGRGMKRDRLDLTLPRSEMSTMATSMPSSEVPLMMPGDSHDRLQLLLQLREQLQGLDGPQFVQVQVADAVGDLMS